MFLTVGIINLRDQLTIKLPTQMILKDYSNAFELLDLNEEDDFKSVAAKVASMHLSSTQKVVLKSLLCDGNPLKQFSAKIKSNEV